MPFTPFLHTKKQRISADKEKIGIVLATEKHSKKRLSIPASIVAHIHSEHKLKTAKAYFDLSLKIKFKTPSKPSNFFPTYNKTPKNNKKIIPERKIDGKKFCDGKNFINSLPEINPAPKTVPNKENDVLIADEKYDIFNFIQ